MMFDNLLQAVEEGHDVLQEVTQLQAVYAQQQNRFDPRNPTHLQQLHPQLRKKIEEGLRKHDGEAQFLRDNGIALVVDDRIKKGHCKKLQMDVWGCHTDSIPDMERQVQVKGFFVRPLKLKERIRLTEKLRVHIDNEHRQSKSTKVNPPKKKIHPF